MRTLIVLAVVVVILVLASGICGGMDCQMCQMYCGSPESNTGYGQCMQDCVTEGHCAQ